MRTFLITTGTVLGIAAAFVLLANLIKRGVHEIATQPTGMDAPIPGRRHDARQPIVTDFPAYDDGTVRGTVCPICQGEGIIHTKTALAFCGCPAGAHAQTVAHAIEQQHPSTS